MEPVIEFLADTNNFGDTRDGSLAGPTGLVVILLLAIGTFFLIRDMNKRLRRLPSSFVQTKEPAESPAATDAPTDEPK